VKIYRALIDISAGMAYLHSLGILHGDLKGGNVLLKSTCATEDPRGFVCKIGDFGLSRVLPADNTHVTTENFGMPSVAAWVVLMQNGHCADGALPHAGTIAYCAPEVIKHGRLTRAADVYSFAMLMTELWTGEGILRGFNSAQVLFEGNFDANLEKQQPDNACMAARRRTTRSCWGSGPRWRRPCRASTGT
jgi:serine/threonine protein kinase